MKVENEQQLLELEGVRDFVDGKLDWFEISSEIRDILYDYYVYEMPYGIQKARTGDPDVWIASKLEKLM